MNVRKPTEEETKSILKTFIRYLEITEETEYLQESIDRIESVLVVSDIAVFPKSNNVNLFVIIWAAGPFTITQVHGNTKEMHITYNID